jgi:hypothetical protein
VEIDMKVNKVTAGPLACVGLACAMGVPAVASFNGFGHLGPAVGVGVAVLVVALCAGGVVRGRSGVAGHAHGGDRRRVAIHEAGHVVAARKLGGRVLSASLSGGGGLVTWDMPVKVYSAQTNVAFLLAGKYAAGTSKGCGGDRAAIRRELRSVPASERSRVQSRAASQARSIVSSHSGEIRRVAARLDERGRL